MSARHLILWGLASLYAMGQAPLVLVGFRRERRGSLFDWEGRLYAR